MRVRYTDTALGEIDEIISYIERNNAAAAEAVADAIKRRRWCTKKTSEQKS